MSGTAPARFTFDLDLARRGSSGTLVNESDVAARVAAARWEGEQQGLAAGEQSAAARAARQLAAAAEQLADRAAAMLGEIDAVRGQTIAEATALALAVARKLVARLMAEQPAAEIERLVGECLSSLDGVPHLVIRCAPDLADAVRDLATRRLANSGFTGRLVVLGDPDIALGDARIEWADGGVVRDIARLSGEIDARINDYFAARGIAPPAQENLP